MYGTEVWKYTKENSKQVESNGNGFLPAKLHVTRMARVRKLDIRERIWENMDIGDRVDAKRLRWPKKLCVGDHKGRIEEGQPDLGETLAETTKFDGVDNIL